MCGPPRRALPQIPRKPCLKNVWAGRVLFFPSSNIAAPHTNHSKNKKISSASPELDYIYTRTRTHARARLVTSPRHLRACSGIGTRRRGALRRCCAAQKKRDHAGCGAWRPPDRACRPNDRTRTRATQFGSFSSSAGRPKLDVRPQPIETVFRVSADESNRLRLCGYWASCARTPCTMFRLIQ